MLVVVVHAWVVEVLLQRSGLVLEIFARKPRISSLPRHFLTFRDAGALTVIENCRGSMFGYLLNVLPRRRGGGAEIIRFGRG